MRPAALSLVTSAVLALAASPALAEDSGGASAPGDSTTAPPAQVGGASTPPNNAQPLARLSVASPMRAGSGEPRIQVRFDEPGVDAVEARIVVLRTPGNAVAARFSLGTVATGRTVSIPWQGPALARGQYLVRVHAHDRWNRQLRRLAHASGKTTLVVKAAPAAPAIPPSSASGVFPVAGAHGFGSPFNEQRKGYKHQGVDITGAEGTPVVSPLAGTVRSTDYQASAAGYYVVLDATDGHAYFFAHCQKKSTAVSAGQTIAAGAAICLMGHTGDATGPHLHFEEWVGGWRVDSNSKPVDPMPQLTAWDS
jgi:murein DD-endopeptidase MepM/ murein hydrolase activator NlpD